MATRRTRAVLGLGIPVLVVLVLFAAWAIDTGSSSGEVPRNVKLAGRPIGGMPEDQLAAAVRDIATAYANAEVQVRIPGRAYRVRAITLGLMLDEDATIKAALGLADRESLPWRPLSWLASFAAARRSPLVFSVSDDQLAAGLAGLEAPGAIHATEPRLVDTGSGMGVISGHSGTAIDATSVKDQLLRRASSGEQPIVVVTRSVTRDPTVSNEQARAFATLVDARIRGGLSVRAGGNQVLIPAATVRTWLGSKPGAHHLELTLDSKRAAADLKAALPPPTAPRDAQLVVTPPATVTVVPSQDGATCCEADSPARLLAAIDAGSPHVDIALQLAHPALTTDAIQKLGIKEPVGTTVVFDGRQQVKSFTTSYDPGQPRVINIHRAADLLRGAIIKPTETFSLNARLGPRLATNGFVPAPPVADGQRAEEVGGGVSQLSTTLFDAAFFAGLDIASSQPHPIYFPRYPFGLDANLGDPGPDLQLRNTTPYAVLVWTSYTASSVTVTLFSTQNVYGEQAGQTSNPYRSCDVVATVRRRHWADGHTSTDRFSAIYQVGSTAGCG